MKKVAFVFLFLGISLKSNASLVNFDAFNDGDGLAAYDATSNLLWLDLSVTAGLSYQNAELSYDGWRHATYLEVDALTSTLFSSYAPNQVLDYQRDCPAGNSCYTEAQDWLSTLGYVADPANQWVQYAFGLYSDENDVLRMSGARVNFVTEFANLYGDNFLVDYSYYENRPAPYNYGTFLVKNFVPPVTFNAVGAPHMLGLLAMGIVLVAWRKRRA